MAADDILWLRISDDSQGAQKLGAERYRMALESARSTEDGCCDLDEQARARMDACDDRKSAVGGELPGSLSKPGTRIAERGPELDCDETQLRSASS